MSESQNSSESIDLETEIINLESSLAKLKERYQQVQTDSARKQELLKEKEAIETELSNNKQDSLKSELKYLQQELTEIELRLESELLNWRQFREPFWQIVRFLGIGIVIGWFVKG